MLVVSCRRCRAVSSCAFSFRPARRAIRLGERRSGKEHRRARESEHRRQRSMDPGEVRKHRQPGHPVPSRRARDVAADVEPAEHARPGEAFHRRELGPARRGQVVRRHRRRRQDEHRPVHRGYEGTDPVPDEEVRQGADRPGRALVGQRHRRPDRREISRALFLLCRHRPGGQHGGGRGRLLRVDARPGQGEKPSAGHQGPGENGAAAIPGRLAGEDDQRKKLRGALRRRGPRQLDRGNRHGARRRAVLARVHPRRPLQLSSRAYWARSGISGRSCSRSTCSRACRS